MAEAILVLGVAFLPRDVEKTSRAEIPRRFRTAASDVASCSESEKGAVPSVSYRTGGRITKKSS